MSERAGIQAGESVCVTGASGFIGSHVVQALLERGYNVRATVRDPGDEAKCAHLQSMGARLDGTLELFGADLTKPGSFDLAISGCSHVCHVASTVRLTARDPQRDIVDVAVNGTANVLGAVLAAGSVRRVVLTSSISAIVDERKPATYTHTEADWNEGATLEASPYPLSKTLAEQTAWSWSKAQGVELIALHPTMVLGPILTKAHARSSPSVIRDLLNGTFPMAPQFNFGIVDVRDVALAHVHALERRGAQGRYIVNGQNAWFSDLSTILRTRHADRKVPRRTMPNALMYIAALFDKRLTWAFLRDNLSIVRQLDAERSRDQLGLGYRSLDESVLDTATSLIEHGVI